MTCTHYEGRVRCNADAVAHITDPDGELVPGARVCWPHGVAPLVEYAEKLGEQWGAVAVDALGRVIR